VLALAAMFGVILVAPGLANLPGSAFEGDDGNLVVNTGATRTG
jgi:hypothetical protein